MAAEELLNWVCSCGNRWSAPMRQGGAYCRDCGVEGSPEPAEPACPACMTPDITDDHTCRRKPVPACRRRTISESHIRKHDPSLLPGDCIREDEHACELEKEETMTAGEPLLPWHCCNRKWMGHLVDGKAPRCWKCGKPGEPVAAVPAGGPPKVTAPGDAKPPSDGIYRLSQQEASALMLVYVGGHHTLGAGHLVMGDWPWGFDWVPPALALLADRGLVSGPHGVDDRWDIMPDGKALAAHIVGSACYRLELNPVLKPGRD